MPSIYEVLKTGGMVPGLLVQSMHGHDTGRLYLVMKVQSRFVWLCDGRLRTLEHMKKKRFCHVKPLAAATPIHEAEELLQMGHADQADAIIRRLIGTCSDHHVTKEEI